MVVKGPEIFHGVECDDGALVVGPSPVPVVPEEPQRPGMLENPFLSHFPFFRINLKKNHLKRVFDEEFGRNFAGGGFGSRAGVVVDAVTLAGILI